MNILRIFSLVYLEFCTPDATICLWGGEVIFPCFEGGGGGKSSWGGGGLSGGVSSSNFTLCFFLCKELHLENKKCNLIYTLW